MGRQASKSARYTLQMPPSDGGLAIPSPQTYYSASQLTHAHWWFHPDTNNAATAIEVAILTSFESLQNLIHRQSTQRYKGTEVHDITPRVFKAAHLIQTGDATALTSNAPLWHNPRLCEFHSWEDGLFWARYGG